MAANPRILISIAGDISDLQRGLKLASAGVSAFKNEISRSFKSFPGLDGQLGEIASSFGRIKASASNIGTGLLGALTPVLAGVATAAAAAGAAMVTMGVKSFRNTVQIADLSERMGVGSNILTAYQFGLQQSGTSMEAFAIGTRRLSLAIAEANDPTSEAGRLFRDLGINVRGRDLPGVLEDLAAVFQKLPEGPMRTAIALKLLGKSGDQLIPFLSSGKEGLAAFRQEAEKLGLIVSPEEAKRVQQLDDNIDALKLSMTGLGNEILGKASPALTNFTTGLREAIKNGNAWNKLAESGLPGFAQRGAQILEQAKATDALTESSKKIRQVEGEILTQKRALMELEKAQTKERTAAIKDNVKDYEGLVRSIRSAIEQSRTAQQGFKDAASEAKNRIASRNETANGDESKGNNLELTIQRMKLIRLAANGTTEEIKKQAELVTSMSNMLDAKNPDNAFVKKDALNEADLALVKANEKDAREEEQRQQGLAEQEKAAQEKIAAFMDQLEELKKSAGEVEVKVEVAAARDALASLQGQLSALKQSAQIRVEIERNTPGGASGSFASGGMVKGPGTDTSDNLLAWLSPREYIVRAASVRRYGVGFLDSINRMSLPRFAAGGLVSKVASFDAQRTAAPENLGRLELAFPNGSSVSVMAEKSIKAEVQKIFRQAAMAHGRRR